MTWADIVAEKLGAEVEYYNYGRQGAGNRYIASLVAQADAVHNFNEDDLVMVSWSNKTRVDYLEENLYWQTHGNIYNQKFYPETFVKNYVNVVDFTMSSLVYLYLTMNMLSRKTNAHFLQMVDMFGGKTNESRVESIFESLQQSLLPAFKQVVKRTIIQENFEDFHPTPKDYLQYLMVVFDGDVWPSDSASLAQEELKRAVKEIAVRKNDRVRLPVPGEDEYALLENYRLHGRKGSRDRRVLW